MLLHALSIRVDRDGKPPVEANAPLPPTFLSAGLGDVLDGEPSLKAAALSPPADPGAGSSEDPGDALGR